MAPYELQGRDAELSELAAHAAAVTAGDGRLVNLVGPAGIGKTALLRVAATGAGEGGLRVLRARGTEAEQSVPYGVVRQLLAAAATDEDLTVAGAAGRGRALVLGEADAAGAGEHAAALGVFWLVAELARAQPLVLVVDDLHWADAPSLRVLDAQRVRLADVPVLLLVAARTLPIGAWAADAGAYELPVGPLADGAVAAIVADAMGTAPTELVAACSKVTGGNPFLLREVLRELKRAHGDGEAHAEVVLSMVPASIVHAASARLAQLGDAPARLATATALLGADVDLGQAARLAGLGLKEATRAVDDLAAAGLLLDQRPLRFVHPLLLAAVRDAIPARERSRLHARAAQALAAEPNALDAVCGHLLQVDPASSEQTVELLRRGAAQATARGAPDTAVAYLRRALTEPPPPGDVAPVTADLSAAAYAVQEPDALELARMAVDVALDPVSTLACAINAGHLMCLAGRPREATELLLTALDAPNIPPPMTAQCVGLAATWSACSLDAREAGRVLVDEARAIASGPDAPLLLRSVAATEAAVGHGTAAEATALAVRAWDDGRLLREAGVDQPFVYFACIAAAVAGETALVARWNERTLEEATRTGSVLGRFAAAIWVGWCHEARGDLPAAEAYLREAIELAAGGGNMAIILPLPVGQLGSIMLQVAGPAEATAALELLPPSGRDPGLMTNPPWALARAEIALADERPDDALAELGAVEAWERGWPAPTNGWATWRPLAVEAHLALDDIDTAAAIAADGVARAEAFGASRQLGRAQRAAALVLPVEKRVPPLTVAAATLDGCDCGADHAICLVDLAEAHLAAGDDDLGLALLRHALDAADAMGADVVAARAHAALVTRGRRPRRRARAGARALTPAERRVADLAASEQSNREIAEALFLTEKTVETHLTNTYRKLGIRSRTQLVEALKAPTVTAT